jgi:cardiolipin synthase
VGSTNLDPRSLRLNFELNLEVWDPDLAGTLAAHFDETRARSHRVTLEEVVSRPLRERLRDAAAKLFSPYL